MWNVLVLPSFKKGDRGKRSKFQNQAIRPGILDESVQLRPLKRGWKKKRERRGDPFKGWVVDRNHLRRKRRSDILKKRKTEGRLL